ncbi:MAG TPA: hypothetical protein VFG58_03345 [Solirubrobacterales bacterium]|nr:hypothetical protein [Solirubrobacterales bacterium]
MKSRLRMIIGALAALSVLALSAPAANAADARFEGISEDGGVAVFSSTDKLVSGDTDSQSDVYVRDSEVGLGYVTREASLGPTGGNDAYAAQFVAVSPDGEEVFFATKERLIAADTDSATDIYARNVVESTTTLVSAGDPSCSASDCGNAEADAEAVPGGVVDAGRRVFFVSTESLNSADTDSGADLYVRNLLTERTTLVSVAGPACSGSCGTGAAPIDFRGASEDGTKAIFSTAEPLVGADTDGEADLYERDLGSVETKLVSTPGVGPEPCPNTACPPSATSTISANGAHVFFETDERIVSGDSDEKQDVYDWSGGTATLASVGPAGENGTAISGLLAGSADGSKAFFSTTDSFSGADTDSAVDIYARGGGTTELVSERDSSCPSCDTGGEAPELNWVSADGLLAIFSTAGKLAEADGDNRTDVYSRNLETEATVLVSLPGASCTDPECGNGESDAGFAGASANGSKVFFVTDEALAPAEPEGALTAFGDSDEQTDVYERGGGATTLVSLGQQAEGGGPYRGNGPFPAQLRAVSADGSLVYFTSEEQLTEADDDSDEDVYARTGGGPLLVSRGNSKGLEAELAPPGPGLDGTDPQSPAASTDPRVLGSDPGAPGASVKLYSTVNCSGEPVGTGSVAQLEGPGIAVHVASGSTSTFHATAEANGFVSACTGEVVYRQQNEVGSGGGGSGGGGGVSRPPVSTGGGARESSGGPRYRTPQSRITFGPAFKTRIRRPVFRFIDSTGQSGTKFICRLDRHRWHRCKSPAKVRKLGRGRHVFRVKAVNAVGVWEAKPSRRVFKLVGVGGHHRKHARHRKRGRR